MKTNNLLLLGGAAVLGYFLIKKAQGESSPGGDNGGYTFDVTPAAPLAPETPISHDVAKHPDMSVIISTPQNITPYFTPSTILSPSEQAYNSVVINSQSGTPQSVSQGGKPIFTTQTIKAILGQGQSLSGQAGTVASQSGTAYIGKSGSSAAASVTKSYSAPPPSTSGNYVYSRAQATSFNALNPKKKII
jgi:hypothetical protein